MTDTTHGPLKPKGAREFTLRAVIAGLCVAAVMGASYPYIVLKLGFGPNVSVVAAFFGYLSLGIVFKNYTRWENNVVQTAGTAAAQTAFMCVLLAAFDLLSANPVAGYSLQLSVGQSFVWLTTAGLLGVLLAVPMRQHFVVDEKLTYADGVAAGETIIVLDSRGTAGRTAALAMFAGTIVSAGVMLMNADATLVKWIPPVIGAGLGTAITMGMGVAVSTSLLSLGSGMLVGLRINLSMLLGMTTSWIVAAHVLHDQGVVTSMKKSDVLFWVMWPATAMLVAAGLTALVLRWKILIKTFKQLSGARVGSEDFPMRWVLIGVAITSVALIFVQRVSLGLPIWMTVVAILLSLPLMLVGLRVLGETNWGPVSALSNMMQGIFAALAPGNVGANMIASGTTGTVAIESEALMQDYKAGDMIGSSPRSLTIMQLLAVPVGAAAVSIIYPLLRDTYGIVGETAGLTSPISQKWANFAVVLKTGLDALPPGAKTAAIIFGLLGVLFTVLEMRWKKYVPSPTGIGIGMLVPDSAIITMFLGGLIEFIWRRVSPKGAEARMIPLASGLIAGEAIIAVVIPLLIVLGLHSI